MDITINAERKLFGLKSAGGYTCFGFDQARDHAAQIAGALKRPDLQPTDADYGTPAGYEKYRRAVSAWGSSVLSRRTYFDPGTPEAVKKALDRYRESGKLVRLFLGDRASGRDWLEENDVVGYIGRSGGQLKVPLLMEPGECGGGAILTACVLRIMDVATNREVFRAPNYQEPDLSLEPCTDQAGYAWEGRRDGQLQARFKTLEEAAEWRAFLRGDVAANREMLRRALHPQRRVA